MSSDGSESRLSGIIHVAVGVGCIVALVSFLLGESCEGAVRTGIGTATVVAGAAVLLIGSLLIAGVVASILGVFGGAMYCLWTGKKLVHALMGYAGGIAGGVLAFGVVFVLHELLPSGSGVGPQSGGMGMLFLVGACAAGGWWSAHLLRDE